MKKVEAQALAPDRSRVVMEYIEKILSGNDKVEGKMNFSTYKIEGQSMCTLDIYVPEENFEKHLNMGITSDHCDVFYAQVFSDFLSNFLEHETIGISRYFEVKYGMGQNFTGVNAINAMGGQIKINFISKGSNFDAIVDEYNRKLDEYVNASTAKTDDEPKIGNR